MRLYNAIYPKVLCITYTIFHILCNVRDACAYIDSKT